MENLYELLEEAAHKVPTKGIVIVNNSQCDLFLTYSELREKSRKIAFILKSYYQVKPVSKIIISVEKSENFILLFWGCVMAGCIPVLMPSVQFSNKNSIAFERLKNAIDILGVVTLITNDINLFEYYKSSFHKAVCVEDIMKQLDLLQDYSLHIPKRDSKDLCVIQFSSGSTGAPKGVMLSFNNILTNLKIKTLADEITTEDTLIHWMPYFHDYGLFGNHLVCLYNQITEIKIEPFSFLRDPLIFLKKISEYQVSICGGTTPSGLDLLIQKLEQSNDIKELDLSQVKTLSIGAEMVPSNLYVRLSPLFQLGFNRNAFRPSYGMAETTLIVSSCLPGYGNKNIRINREAFYEGIIKLVDKQQDFCEFVSAGSIYLKGGYMRNKEGLVDDLITSIPGEWKFDEQVSQHFDTHVRKSVPLYEEVQKAVIEISEWFIRDNSVVYDLGSSTGETISLLLQKGNSGGFGPWFDKLVDT